MALLKWDPFKDLLTIQERMNRLFDETLSKAKAPCEGIAGGGWSPPVDIYETEEHIILKAELPGIDKRDIEVEIQDNILALKGERRFEKNVQEENYHRMERSYGSFQRAFTLPYIVNKDDIKAKYNNGVLEITLQKILEQKPKAIKIEAR
ncbi:MAG: Hsp20/alpha crystallin family protein [Deltaproteobacteria bacterium]|nr:Hsp20/alpha crystallin family protein [Deltaproteobacteria bacterium]